LISSRTLILAIEIFFPYLQLLPTFPSYF
jgi:hypothetical protein